MEAGYILCGSFHDMITHFNVTPILRWPDSASWISLTDKNGDSPPNPIMHLKMTQAIRVPEFIQVDPKQWPKIYLTNYCQVSIMVCSDVFRSGFVHMIQNLAKRANKASKGSAVIFPEIIFVPSYSPKSKKVWEACKFMSQYTTALVVFANAQTQPQQSPDDRPRMDVFFAGDALSENTGDMTSWIQQKDIQLDEGTPVRQYDICSEEFIKRKKVFGKKLNLLHAEAITLGIEVDKINPKDYLDERPRAPAVD
jgi:hypothetical protein